MRLRVRLLLVGKRAKRRKKKNRWPEKGCSLESRDKSSSLVRWTRITPGGLEAWKERTGLGLSEQIRSLIYILMDLNWNLLDARLKINRRGRYSGYLLFILGLLTGVTMFMSDFFLSFFFFLEVVLSNACRGYNYKQVKDAGNIRKKDFNFSMGKKIMILCESVWFKINGNL